MRGGWKRFGIYIGAVLALIAVAFVATRNEPNTAGLVIAQLVFIGGMSYLLTFLVWPRRVPQSDAHPSKQQPRTSRQTPGPRPQIDRRPAPVVSAQVEIDEAHLSESPTARMSRGRRPDRRPATAEIKWPAQR